MVVTVHRLLKVIAFSANGIGRQAYELQKQMQDLKIELSLFLGDMSETTYGVLHSKLSCISECSPRRA
jgi:hypothetical protein